MLVGVRVAPLPSSFPPSGTQAFYFINRPPWPQCNAIWSGCPVWTPIYNFSIFWLHKNVYPNSTMLTISRNSNNIMILCCVAVCHLLRSGVAALFGPQSGTTSSHVQSICDAMEIPHIETRWDYRLRRDEYSVNLYPHPSALSKVSPSLHTN